MVMVTPADAAVVGEGATLLVTAAELVGEKDAEALAKQPLAEPQTMAAWHLSRACG